MCFSFCYVYIFYICVVDRRCLVEFEKLRSLCGIVHFPQSGFVMSSCSAFAFSLQFCRTAVLVCFVVGLFPFVIIIFFFSFFPIIYYFHLLLLVIVLVDKAEQICNYCAWFSPIHIKPQKGLLHSGLVFKLCSSAQ